MTYSPPSGWVETLSEIGQDVPLRWRFHTRTDCPRIRPSAALRQVDRPYSAPRCNLCAPDNQSLTSRRP